MYIKVKVIAGAKKENVEKVKVNEYKISVREPAERNLANSRIIFLVAKEISIPQSRIRIISGHHSPSKILSVRDVIIKI